MKERKENIKKFWSEHKKEIIIGTGLTVIGVVGCAVGIKHIKNRNISDAISEFDWESFKKGLSPDEQALLTLHEEVDMIREGCECYIPINLDEFKKMNNGYSIISCGNGAELMDVKGLIAFGNKIEA